jgi:hypothetical protein
VGVTKTYEMVVWVTDKYGDLIDPDDRYRTLEDVTKRFQDVFDEGGFGKENVVVKVTAIIEDTSGYEVEYDSGGGPYAQREKNL